MQDQSRASRVLIGESSVAEGAEAALASTANASTAHDPEARSRHVRF